MTRVVGWGLVLVAGACADDGYRVHVHAPSGLALLGVEIAVVGSCDAVATAGDPPSQPILVQVFFRGTDGVPLGHVGAGRYGLYARAWDDSCRIVAAGCSPVELEGGGTGTLDVFLVEMPLRPCGADDVCAASCPTAVDAGSDARLDAGSDSGADAGADGGTDAGSDAGTDAGADAGADAGCAPAIVGSLDTGGVPRAFALAGTTAFVAASTYGLKVVDLSDPTAPEEVGELDTPGSARDLVLSEDGDLLYLADDDQGLAVIDVSDPRAPLPVGSVNRNDLPVTEARAVALSGTHALVAWGNAGLQVVDVSDPGAPVLDGNPLASGTCDAVVIDGEVAFVLFEDFGLQVIDLSGLPALAVLGTAETADPRDLRLAGDLALVADDVEGLVVVDVADPSAPVAIERAATLSAAQKIALRGDLAFLTTEGDDLPPVAATVEAFDFSRPDAPTRVALAELEGQGFGVADFDPFVLAGDDVGGADFLRVVDLCLDPP